MLRRGQFPFGTDRLDIHPVFAGYKSTSGRAGPASLEKCKNVRVQAKFSSEAVGAGTSEGVVGALSDGRFPSAE
jgi:hypothetical protein